MKILLFSVVLSFFLISCGGSKNNDLAFDHQLIIPEDSLILIIMDMHIMDAAAKQNVVPNNIVNLQKYKQYKAVFEKHSISKTRFDSTLFLYTRNGEKYDELYEKVIERLTVEEEALSK
jgi:uncharacterized GH25 family protein